jgi:DNA-binding CsgD family transcriptional regulator/tetratricopeptide (TPR) repeat protein
MELIERDNFLTELTRRFAQAIAGEGHCFFITGESGIGKTSLVKTFLKRVEEDSMAYTGTCDSLFTPRPLAPLYDISLQMKGNWADIIQSISARSELFTRILHALSHQALPVVLVFEDVHWADEATLDFIKYLGRRISQLKCLFILTFRDNEINQQHPLKNLPGDLASGTYTHLQLTPFSKQTVQKMADEKGYDGENVFAISGGNPFYVNEILASYSQGVPDNIRNAVLSTYNRQEEKTKNVWQLLSIIPEGLELERLAAIDTQWQDAIENSLAKKILILKENKIFFKHELYRRTIEESLLVFKRIELNKYVLGHFLEDFEKKAEIERIVHYAKNANENQLVVRYAPLAAKKAALVGAHIEASKLLLTCIGYHDKTDMDGLVQLYEDYGYECYLINQIKEAINYIGKALTIRKKKKDAEQIGNCLRLLSRLWWFEGDRRQAEDFGKKAIDMLDRGAASRAKAMAYSNMSQLKNLSDQTDECIFWGKKAIDVAKEINDQETIAHALNSMGSTLILIASSKEKGVTLLQQSLEISLTNSYHEHVARAYSGLGCNLVSIKDYPFARKMLDEGIHYCEEKEIDSLRLYMLSWKGRLLLETGYWDEAFLIAENLLKKEKLPAVIEMGTLVIKATVAMRKGYPDALALLLASKSLTFEVTELYRILPVFFALMEYEWITGENLIETEILSGTLDTIIRLQKFSKKSRLYFWLKRTGKDHLIKGVHQDSGKLAEGETSLDEAAYWEKLGCPYEQAVVLSESGENDKRKALQIMQQLGATGVYEKMKMDMRSAGIKKIPRGMRENTKANPAQLTNRELEVLFLLTKGIQNKEIAVKLFISPKTVDHHISAVLFKLDVSSRTKAVTEAIRLGIISQVIAG